MGAAQEEGYWKYTSGYLANTCDQVFIQQNLEYYEIIFDFFLQPAENGSQKNTSLRDGENLCDKVILLGDLLLRFLS